MDGGLGGMSGLSKLEDFQIQFMWGGDHMGIGVKIAYACSAAEVLSGWARQVLFPSRMRA